MPVILTATQCPTPQVPSAMTTIAGATSTASTGGLVAVRQGLGTNTYHSDINSNWMRMDLLGQNGGGARALSGYFPISLSAGSGLTLNLSAGQALCDGVIEISAATTVNLTDNQARIWIWLNQSGTISLVNNSLTPPSANSVLIGSAVTASGAITSVDTSGVLYLYNGRLWRQTNDVGAPKDTPPASLRFETMTADGTYLWQGTGYLKLSSTFATDTVPSGSTVVLPVNTQQILFAPLTVYGTYSVYGRLRTIP